MRHTQLILSPDPEYMVATFGASHYVAGDGGRAIVTALAKPLPPAQVHLSSTLSSLSSSPSPIGRPHVVLHSSDEGVSPLKFAHVILATQANQARTLLATMPHPSAAAKARLAALGAFSYEKSLVVTHSDESVLPSALKDRRDLTFASHARETSNPTAPPPQDDSDHRSRGWIQATHTVSTHPLILQTTNLVTALSPSLTHRSTWFERAVVSRSSRAALPGFLLPDGDGDGAEGEGVHQGVDGVWLVGSWAAEGCPLLEGCVASAERVVGAVARREGWGMVME